MPTVGGKCRLQDLSSKRWVVMSDREGARSSVTLGSADVALTCTLLVCQPRGIPCASKRAIHTCMQPSCAAGQPGRLNGGRMELLGTTRGKRNSHRGRLPEGFYYCRAMLGWKEREVRLYE